MKIFAALVLALLLAPVAAHPETVYVEATHDATLIEHPDGELANGAGPVFFAGRTGQQKNGARRGLLHFDVAAALPRNARVESVHLSLVMMPSNSKPAAIGLHRLLEAWGEGDSYASGGSGDFAQPGDATWIHAFYDSDEWVKPGAHFVARASSVREVGAAGPYTWPSTRKAVADVRLWLAMPQRNFGWLLLGDETTPQSVKSFASREEADPLLRPVLEITYHLPHE